MAVAVVAGCTDPCSPKRKSHVGNRVWRGTDHLHRARRLGASRGRKGRRGGAICSIITSSNVGCANDGLRPCPADVSLFEAAVVFVVSPTTACKGLASRPPAVGVQRAVHKMPISVGQRPRETKHGKCDLARGPEPCNLLPTPASHPDSREMFLLPIELQPAQYCSSSSSMSGSKPGIEVRSLAAREELSSVRRGLTGSSGQLGGGARCLRTYDQDVRSPM